MDTEQSPEMREFRDGYRWDGVVHMPYKQDGSAPFKDVSRQVLFQQPGMGCELRYFEVGAGGYSTLEQHEHAHAVMILRGHGQCLLGSEVTGVKPFDLVTIPSWTWHQFRATQGEPLGFLCMVNQQRDRPRLPTADDLAALRALPTVAEFLES